MARSMTLQNLAGVGFGQRSAEDREILRENVNQPAVDPSVTGTRNRRRAGAALSMPKSTQRCVTNLSSFLEGAFVEQQLDAFARGELSRFVLALAPFGASACFGFGAAAQFVEWISGMLFREPSPGGLACHRGTKAASVRQEIFCGAEKTQEKSTGGTASQDNTMVARRRFGSDSDCWSRLVSDYSTNTERAAVADIRRDNTMVARIRYLVMTQIDVGSSFRSSNLSGTWTKP